MRVLNPITSGPPHNAVTSARAARTRNAANLRRSCPAAQARAERGSSTALIFFDSRRAESSIRTPRSVCVPVGGAADAAAAPNTPWDRRARAHASGTRPGGARVRDRARALGVSPHLAATLLAVQPLRAATEKIVGRHVPRDASSRLFFEALLKAGGVERAAAARRAAAAWAGVLHLELVMSVQQRPTR